MFILLIGVFSCRNSNNVVVVVVVVAVEVATAVEVVDGVVVAAVA